MLSLYVIKKTKNMKRNKLIWTSPEKAEVIYSVFETCNVFTLLLNGDLVPVYDFSGNGRRSSLNSLRKFYTGSKVAFYCESSFYSRVSLPRPPLSFSSCLLFF